MERFDLKNFLSGHPSGSHAGTESTSPSISSQNSTLPASTSPSSVSPASSIRDQMRGLLLSNPTKTESDLIGNNPFALGPQKKKSVLPPAPTFLQKATRSAQAEHAEAASSQGTYSPYSLKSINFPPSVFTLLSEIMKELEGNMRNLLSLNPSRRESVAQYLDRLAGITPGPSGTMGAGDAAAGLRRWVDGPRSPAQNTALQSFFEEVALFTFGQALILKAWSDRGLRNLKEDDLGRLNWELNCGLKQHVPLDREGWQLTRPNLYSWYNPTRAIQKEIWSVLNSLNLKDEPPSFLSSILRGARQFLPRWPEMEGYDPRFFDSIWKTLPTLGLDLSDPNATNAARYSNCVLKRSFFTPTLRDGMMMNAGPSHVQWIGLESHPFLILFAEMIQCWWGPTAPPLWTTGIGLEVHSRDQLSFSLGSPKPSIINRISEMEACDFAWIIEERVIRSNSRSFEAARFKQIVDQLPYFKKLRNAGTSLGDLQACVSLTKVRPGGLMLWAREEPLSATDGMEALGFLMDRAKILCEWDLSKVEHSLPSRVPLFPKYLYLLQRESDVEARLTHRPTRITLQGQIRSHIEVPLILEDAMQSYSKSSVSRGNWKIHTYKSPTPQKDWAERWPDQASHVVIDALDELRNSSLPLASVTTVRVTPHGHATVPGAPASTTASGTAASSGWSLPNNALLKGFWIEAKADRKIVAHSLPTPERPAHGTGFLILVSDAAWSAPLRCYLESDCVKNWLDHHTERRGDRWVLNESVVKYIPVPKTLLKALGHPAGELEARDSLSITQELQSILNEVPYQPKQVMARLNTINPDTISNPNQLRAMIFARAASALEELRKGQGALLSMVGIDGQIHWKKLIEILPRTECIPFTQHPSVRILGSLPLHVSINRIEKIKTPQPAILLVTESGFNLRIVPEHSVVFDMLYDQIRDLVHPTWSELSQLVRLPRRLELAETAASDILRSHGEQSSRLQELTNLVSACQNF